MRWLPIRVIWSVLLKKLGTDLRIMMVKKKFNFKSIQCFIKKDKRVYLTFPNSLSFLSKKKIGTDCLSHTYLKPRLSLKVVYL
jgi:hypothetical protein